MNIMKPIKHLAQRGDAARGGGAIMITRKEQQSHSVREFMRGGKKHVSLTELSTCLPGNMRMFSLLTLIPGASIGYHVHENETEMFYFLEGNGRVMDDDKAYDIGAGDSMATFSGHGHSVENTGDTNLLILAAIIRD